MAALPLVDPRQCFESSIERQEIDLLCLRNRQVLVERHGAGAATTFLHPASSRVIDQHATHQASSDPQEVSAILPAEAAGVHQSHEHLVDKGAGLQRVATPLARHVDPGQPPQFRLDGGDEPVERGLVTSGPRAEQFGDRRLRHRHILRRPTWRLGPFRPICLILALQQSPHGREGPQHT
jgi:hypothetical protein